MTTVSAFWYFAIGTVLFFFWVYGIVSFVVDVRRQIIPLIRSRWGDDDEPEEEEPVEQLSELYGDTEK